MSYTPTEWKTGDVVTAEKLNNMESGIANSGNIKYVNKIINETKSIFPITPAEFEELNGAVLFGGVSYHYYLADYFRDDSGAELTLLKFSYNNEVFQTSSEIFTANDVNSYFEMSES